MLRAAPHQVGAVARPLVVQHGYASYLAHLPAFLKAYNDQTNVPFNRQGYPATLAIEKCIDIGNPSLVIDFNGPIPAKHVEALGHIGFERIKMNRTDNIIRFPTVTLEQVREIRGMNPNMTTPAPVNTVNLQSFESWVLVTRVVSNLLLAHTYPAFSDDDHLMDELDDLTEELLKRKAETELANSPKRVRQEAGMVVNPDEIDINMEGQDDDPKPSKDTEIELKKAKPPPRNGRGWGTPSQLPNASGLFFPFIPELCSYDTVTVPVLIEDYLIQSLGDKPERQLERMDRIRSAWGIVGKTDPGNAMAHMCKVISLALRAQGRAFPFVHNGIYQGCVLSGGRLFVGMNGVVYRPISYEKLQEETGGFHMHSIVLKKIVDITEETVKVLPDTMRKLRQLLLRANLSEEDRDEIRKLAVHLHFQNERFLPLNPQSVGLLIQDMTSLETTENTSLPLHHSALFSRDKVFVALSAFGYQAPSFMIDNCPKITLNSSKPPQTLVVRQKPLDIATVDWKKMLESKEVRNNPRNLSRANRDRSIVGNDKAVVWGELAKMATEMGGSERDASGIVDNEAGGVAIDGMDDW